jgi:VWFA-related protein
MRTRFVPSSAPSVTARLVVAIALASGGALLLAQGQTPPPPQTQKPPATQGQAPPGQPPAQQGQQAQQPPVFRAGANFVRVDAYPTVGGKPVMDLKQEDFELSEDGVPQKVDTFEHVVIQAPTVLDRARAPEPNTVAQSREMVAESKARLFVLFLDTYHISREGALNSRAALTRFLYGALGPDDLIAVTTPELPVGAVTFARRTESIEAMLERFWRWSRRGALAEYDPIEEQYMRCYPMGPGDAGGMSATAREMIRRRRERMTLESLQGLVVHLGGLREERKAVLAVSEGWILYSRDSQVPMPTMASLSRLDAERSRCETDRAIFAQEDHGLDFRQMLNDANRANVSFYPMDPRGLVVFDTPINEGLSVVADAASLRTRLDSLRTMAENTDGVAIVNSNDLDRGLRRVVDDLSSYYLLGYYSSNPKTDGSYRAIKVRVKRSGVDVRHRRGYRAATKADIAEIASVMAAKSSPPSPVASAVSSLGRVRTDAVVQARASYTWAAAADGSITPVLWLVGEWDLSVASRDEQWKAGADVGIAVTAPDKASLENSKQTVTRETRGFVLRVPVPAGQSAGDYSLRITTKPVGVSLGSTETLHVVLPQWPKAGAIAVGQPQLFRRGPYTGTTFVAAADLRFRRQERLKVEVGVLGPMTAGEVRLLDRAGNPLSVPVVSATRDENGAKVVSGEVVLAPLGVGDYVLETTITQGATTQKVLAAFKIVP